VGSFAGREALVTPTERALLRRAIDARIRELYPYRPCECEQCWRCNARNRGRDKRAAKLLEQYQ
jgi:hypothetical protein